MIPSSVAKHRLSAHVSAALVCFVLGKRSISVVWVAGRSARFCLVVGSPLLSWASDDPQ